MATGQARRLPLVDRVFAQPVAAKVPEIVAMFWVVKILTTAGGEATSDWLAHAGNIVGGGTELLLFVAGLVVQFGCRRYHAVAYWFFAYSIAIFGTGAADFMHLDLKIPYAGTTLLWATVLAAIFWLWHRSEGTLSIHSITTRRCECFYWSTVFATFALGTALGDLTATGLNLGYLTSGIMFAVIIVLPALAWWRFGLNAVAAFWLSYVVTRPLGASFADYVRLGHALGGLGLGDAATTATFTVAVVVLVAYLALARPDIQRPAAVVSRDEQPRTLAAGLPRGAGRPA